MTMRTRQVAVAAGLVVLALWALLTWVGSASTPQPTTGPSPTGAIGPGPATFEPSEDASPPP